MAIGLFGRLFIIRLPWFDNRLPMENNIFYTFTYIPFIDSFRYRLPTTGLVVGVLFRLPSVRFLSLELENFMASVNNET